MNAWSISYHVRCTKPRVRSRPALENLGCHVTMALHLHDGVFVKYGLQSAVHKAACL